MDKCVTTGVRIYSESVSVNSVLSLANIDHIMSRVPDSKNILA